MAIGNVTPDSFYAASRLGSTDAVVSWAQQALADGADILDIGACSTRPGSTPASEEEEWRRLEPALAALRSALPEAQLSVDTFRPEIARRALDQFGSLIINDISGGCESMYDDRFNEGNLREKSLREIWENPDGFAYNRKFKRSMLTGPCADCKHGAYCAGGCRSYNFFVHGKLYEAPRCASALDQRV